MGLSSARDQDGVGKTRRIGDGPHNIGSGIDDVPPTTGAELGGEASPNTRVFRQWWYWDAVPRKRAKANPDAKPSA